MERRVLHGSHAELSCDVAARVVGVGSGEVSGCRGSKCHFQLLLRSCTQGLSSVKMSSVNVHELLEGLDPLAPPPPSSADQGGLCSFLRLIPGSVPL